MVVPGRDLVVVRGVRGQRRVPALRGPDLRGLQGILQADRPEERQVRLPRRQELSGGQAAAQPVPGGLLKLLLTRTVLVRWVK